MADAEDALDVEGGEDVELRRQDVSTDGFQAKDYQGVGVVGTFRGDHKDVFGLIVQVP